MMEIYRLPLDFITMTICTWNTAVVGVIAIFWYSPLWLQQGYLIIISAATVRCESSRRINTILNTFYSLSVYWECHRGQLGQYWLLCLSMVSLTSVNRTSLYIDPCVDLFAVLCPSGPLKLLIKIAEERQEDIPALVYTAGMADFNNSNSPIGGYITRESSRGNSKWSWLSIFKNNNKGYHTIQNEDEVGFLENNMGMNQPQVNELAELPPTTSDHHRRNRQQQDEDEDEEDEDLNAIKLGLGDFIFYSVLVGKASRTDSVTLCLCIIAILTVKWVVYPIWSIYSCVFFIGSCYHNSHTDIEQKGITRFTHIHSIWLHNLRDILLYDGTNDPVIFIRRYCILIHFWQNNKHILF